MAHSNHIFCYRGFSTGWKASAVSRHLGIHLTDSTGISTKKGWIPSKAKPLWVQGLLDHCDLISQRQRQPEAALGVSRHIANRGVGGGHGVDAEHLDGGIESD
jgi:hypothetical protein